MALHFRSGVDLRQMAPQILVAWEVAAEVFESHGHTAWVTSLYRAGPWETTLLHGKGLAIDIGLRDAAGELLPDGTISAIVAELRARLGKEYGGQFDVVDERGVGASAGWTGAHVHLEFDPQ
jgi:hypothetical protein